LQYSKSRGLKPSRPRLAKMGLETSLETETKSRDSITAYNAEYFQTLPRRNGDRLPTVCVAC